MYSGCYIMWRILLHGDYNYKMHLLVAFIAKRIAETGRYSWTSSNEESITLFLLPKKSFRSYSYNYRPTYIRISSISKSAKL